MNKQLSAKELFKKALDENMYFSLRGCEEEGKQTLPKFVLNFISNVAGICTDSNEGEDYYKNARAMFVALDLIYLILDAYRGETKT